MSEQSDTPPEEEQADAVERCTVCGREIDPTTWHPVATHFDDDGEFHLRVFCSVECRTARDGE